jgi:glutamyl-tRNA synthetase
LSRVRFAPSPTGRFHIGSARTALYNVLLARQTGGQFILRIEDTDLKRNKSEYLDEIKEAMRWLGLRWDEGPDVGGPHAPYTQTARKDIYLHYAQQLVASGHAYPCFCTPERLQAMRAEQMLRKETLHYDGLCRRLEPAEAAARAAAGEKHTIRFKTPREGSTTVRDHLRGDITIENQFIDDYILVKSDGFALYHLAAMVDDRLMGITHVVRGSEWLGTLPLHALILRAFGWQEPVWVHLSVFLKPTGKGKMSKRDVTSEQSIFVLGLRDLGYVPEGILAWISLMGASFGAEEEYLTVDDMTAKFSLDHLNPAPARVNFEKLDHYNGLAIRQMDAADLAGRLAPFFQHAGLEVEPGDLRPIVPIIRERIVTLDDAVAMAGFFFRPPPRPGAGDLQVKGLTPDQCRVALSRAREVLESLPAERWTHATLEAQLRALADELSVKAGQLFSLLRTAVTGQTVSPPLMETMAILGRERSLESVRYAELQLQQVTG